MLVELPDQRVNVGRVERRAAQRVQRRDDADVGDVGCVGLAQALGQRADVIRARPTAAPTAGPSATFCGRSPIAPAAAPATAATGSGPAPVRRCAAQPAGAAIAPLAMIRDQRAGISPGFCRDLAMVSAAITTAPPATAPATARLFDRPPEVSAAPASAPIGPTEAHCRRSFATLRTYRGQEQAGPSPG